MKLIALPVAVLLAASVMSAQTPAPAVPAAPAAPTAPAAPAKPSDITITDGKIDTGKPADVVKTPAKKDEKKKEEPMGKIAGLTISRPNGTFLGLEVVGGNFKLTFYDKKKKPMKVDVARATAQWPDKNGPHDNRTVLNGSGTFLVGSKPVIPPYTFIVFLNLLQGEGDATKVVENYQVHLGG